jgi:hypothetical protein
MGKINNFIQQSSHKDLDKWEKIYGRYGCKFCKENTEFAYWDRNKSQLVWVCRNDHRSEMQFD